jgi:hypothetical protein
MEEEAELTRRRKAEMKEKLEQFDTDMANAGSRGDS